MSELDIQATRYFVSIRHFWFVGLQIGNGRDWGFGRINDRSLDRTLKFFREWEAEYLMEYSI